MTTTFAYNYCRDIEGCERKNFDQKYNFMQTIAKNTIFIPRLDNIDCCNAK